MPIKVEDLFDIEARACEYTGSKRAFVIYRSGTVVFSDTSCSRDDEDYNATLKAAVLPPPDFKVVPTHDGNYLVRFAGPVTGARLQRDSGEVIMELVDVQVDTIKASRMVIKRIERRQTERGVVEIAQAWPCVQARTPLLETSRERFFKQSGDGRQ